jgi:proton glutamate symport protein
VSTGPAATGSARLTIWSLGALVLGLGLGMGLHGSQTAWVSQIAAVLTPLGALWVRGLGLLVIPLIVSLAVLAVFNTPEVGRLGARAILIFATMLGAAGLLTLVVGPLIVSLYDADPASIAALRAGTTIPDAAIAMGTERPLADWLRAYIPASLDTVLRGTSVLVLLIGATLGALVLRRFAASRLPTIQRSVEWLAAITQRVVRYILLVSPLGIFALTFGFGLRSGVRVAGFMLAAAIIVPGVLLLFTALLYPVTAVFGKTSIRTFARAAAPAQLVAICTQSSLASLPALVEGGREHLALPVSATGFVLPLAVAVFKLNRTISGPVQLILLTHAFGVPLSPLHLVLFTGASFLQSFFTPGIPGGSSPYFTLPLYVAAGAPIEGVVLLATVDVVLDIFKTLTNVTGDLSAATIFTASVRARSVT